MLQNILASAKPISLGPCRIEYDINNPDGYVVIDRTKGGCHFKYKINTDNITMDQTGDTPQDMILSGSECVAECPMVSNDIELLARTTPGAVLYTNATTQSKSLEFTTPAGTSLLATAKVARIVPLTTDDPTQIITIPKAIIIPDWDKVYDPKNPQITLVRIYGMIDQATRMRSFFMGDEANLPA